MAITRSMDRARRMAVKHYRLIQAQDQLIDLADDPTPVSLSIPFVCGNCLKRTITVEVNLNEERRFQKTEKCSTCDRRLRINEPYRDPNFVAVIDVTGDFSFQMFKLFDDYVRWEVVVDGFTLEISTDNDGSWSFFDKENERDDDEDEEDDEDDEDENEDEEDDDYQHNYDLDEENEWDDDEDEEDDEDENEDEEDDDYQHNYDLDEENEWDDDEDEEDDEDENEDEEDDDYQHNYDLDEENDTELDPNFDDEAEFVPDEEYYQGEDEDDGEGGGYFPSCTGLCINVVEFEN
ncbi:hypothetical protein L1887_27812 [Cichorium endivia]|nr:hypothetical protein L1887_27809 [Cichorium endivia]KAI3505664.1 hypothetical protein L1887_27812 [Cichorium endivia]